MKLPVHMPHFRSTPCHVSISQTPVRRVSVGVGVMVSVNVGVGVSVGVGVMVSRNVWVGVSLQFGNSVSPPPPSSFTLIALLNSR